MNEIGLKNSFPSKLCQADIPINTGDKFSLKIGGTTFERAGFKEMEAMIGTGKVSTVIVKDLSRFGRNYLEVGQYLEIKYPTLGVHFIAIQENVDSAQSSGAEMMPFHNICRTNLQENSRRVEIQG